MCVRGFMYGGLSILVGVMVIYVSHHWPVMMSWCHLIGSPWCHHIPRMVGHKYSLSLVDGSVDLWPTLWKELCHCLSRWVYNYTQVLSLLFDGLNPVLVSQDLGGCLPSHILGAQPGLSCSCFHGLASSSFDCMLWCMVYTSHDIDL